MNDRGCFMQGFLQRDGAEASEACFAGQAFVLNNPIL